MIGSGRGAPTSLTAARRERDLAELWAGARLDLLVVGGGVTGAGVALDAAARGLSVALVEKHDLAFGTSRWSSKLVHGGLRYLASGQVGIAYECAVERGVLLQRTAPHLVRPLIQVFPEFAARSRAERLGVRGGVLAGDLLRLAVRTPAALLPRSRRRPAAEGLRLVPALRRDGLRSVLVAYDGQLVDDARLVVALARTAAGLGARVVTRCAAEQVTGTSAVLRDTLSGATSQVRARAVVNAAGVWAGEVSPGLRLRPSRGTHVVVAASALGDPVAELVVPVPGDFGRFVFAVPAGDGRVYVGITDVAAPEPVPDVPLPDAAEVRGLIADVGTALRAPVPPEAVLGAFAGLRPLLAAPDGRTADLSRRHAVVVDPSGLVSVVGGKLTTYRAMAQDAVDRAVQVSGLQAGPCRTRRLPLVGAADRAALAAVRAPARLVARYGTEAERLLTEAGPDPRWHEPIAPGVATTRAELAFAVAHEGAQSEEDLLDRRTRVGLVATDRELALPAAREVLAQARDA